jgi:membrane-bound lytic murein transglycosylase MltF
MLKPVQLLFLLLAIFLIAVGLYNPEPAPDNSVAAPASTPGTESVPAQPIAEPAAVSLEFLELVTTAQSLDFDAMVEARTIRALVVRSKTFYFLDGAVQRGLSYDALMAFEKFINKQLGNKTLKLRVHFIPVARDQLIPALEAGYGDIASANITITPERLLGVDFSMPMKSNVREVLVTGNLADKQLTLEQMSGRSVHTRLSSSYFESLQALNKTLTAQGKPPVKIVAVDEHLEDEDLLEMVNAGLIPAIVIDSHKAEFWRQIFADIVVHNDVVLRDNAEVAWAIRKQSPVLLGMVNGFLRKNREGTLLGNILLQRYLKETRYVDKSLSTPEMQKFNATAHLFKEYADRYDFDWLLVMSQAYQESRLDQSARSNAGAVGIMQIKPSTAADKNVAIADISELENNIHAGIKYLRFIRNRYFEAEPMDELNKTLFSFAAYNAGPARIARLRKQTASAGLDPNIWFDNVELITARHVGREPVQYVSNIYKYWIAYRLSREHFNEVADLVAP